MIKKNSEGNTIAVIKLPNFRVKKGVLHATSAGILIPSTIPVRNKVTNKETFVPSEHAHFALLNNVCEDQSNSFRIFFGKPSNIQITKQPKKSKKGDNNQQLNETFPTFVVTSTYAMPQPLFPARVELGTLENSTNNDVFIKLMLPTYAITKEGEKITVDPDYKEFRFNTSGIKLNPNEQVDFEAVYNLICKLSGIIDEEKMMREEKKTGIKDFQNINYYYRGIITFIQKSFPALDFQSLYLIEDQIYELLIEQNVPNFKIAETSELKVTAPEIDITELPVATKSPTRSKKNSKIKI